MNGPEQKELQHLSGEPAKSERSPGGLAYQTKVIAAAVIKGELQNQNLHAPEVANNPSPS